jgi:hypothetical protein
MSQGKQVRGPSGGNAPAAGGSEQALAPGRRTLTMDLPPSSPEPVVQRAVAEPSAGSSHALPTPPLAAIVRPDLFASPIQRQVAGPVPEAGAPPAPTGGGQPMAGGIRAHMEHAFGADFSAVRVHEGPQAPALGALAYTQGADIHFAPGAYAPDSQGGRQLLGHELAHVVQQAEGKVTTTTQAKGVGINDDSALEREADDKGARAAR